MIRKAKTESFDQLCDRARLEAQGAIRHLLPIDLNRLGHALELGLYDETETFLALEMMDRRAVLALARWAVLNLP